MLQVSMRSVDRGQRPAGGSSLRLCRNLMLLAIPSVIFGCGRSTPPSPPAGETSTPPAGAALAVPSFSAAQKVGMFVFPKNNQNHDQQLRDELDCYGDAGKGAAIGAAAGTVRGGRRQRESNEATKEQAAQSATAQLQQQYQQAKAAYSSQQETFKRGFAACLDARGYSVK